MGDECYVFEQYIPAVSNTLQPVELEVVWYRGYVVNSSHQSSLSNLSTPAQLQYAEPDSFTSSNNTQLPTFILPDEPQVFLGIFPASHLQVREQLEDSSHRLSRTFAQLNSNVMANSNSVSSTIGVNGIRTFNDKSGRMDPLLEEDETESSLPASHSQFLRTIDGLIGSELIAGANQSQADKLTPPLPSLKAGDETASGRDEPLVDEIACALREWYTLLFVHLNKRQYRLFHIMKEHIEALHMGRRQLLAQTLSTEEAAKLRQDLVNRLVYGNLVQDLDIIVRHPDYGALVDTEVDFESVDSRSWMSTVRMYVAQVKLAYLSQALSPDRGFMNGPLNLPDPLTNNALLSMSTNTSSKLAEPNQVPLNAHLPNCRSSQIMITSGSQSESSPNLSNQPSFSAPGTGARPKFYHVMLDVKSFLASPCTPGETIELYFSLYSKSDSRFLTEEFCVILNHLGLPVRSKSDQSLSDRSGASGAVDEMIHKPTSANLVSLRTMFKDLSQHDVQDSIFLVCRLVKNGLMKSSPPAQSSSAQPGGLQESTSNSLLSPSVYVGDFNAGTHLFDETTSPTPEAGGAAPHQYALPDSNGEYSGMTFNHSRLGGQSIRRPFGCAVVEISSFSSTSNAMLGSSSVAKLACGGNSGVLESPVSQYSMNIFSPVNEASFPTLHEDIIASRVKEFFGSGNLSSGANFNGSYGSSSKLGHNPSGLKNESIAIELRTFYGDTNAIIKHNVSLLNDIPLTSRLGFPDVVFPDDCERVTLITLLGT